MDPQEFFKHRRAAKEMTRLRQQTETIARLAADLTPETMASVRPYLETAFDEGFAAGWDAGWDESATVLRLEAQRLAAEGSADS